MSTELIKHLPSPSNRAASEPTWLSGVAAAVSRAGGRVWRALEASGAARAERELRLLASYHSSESELGRVYRAAAQHLRSDDPLSREASLTAQGSLLRRAS